MKQFLGNDKQQIVTDRYNIDNNLSFKGGYPLKNKL